MPKFNLSASVGCDRVLGYDSNIYPQPPPKLQWNVRITCNSYLEESLVVEQDWGNSVTEAQSSYEIGHLSGQESIGNSPVVSCPHDQPMHYTGRSSF